MAETLTVGHFRDADGPTSREALLQAALRCFEDGGYAGSRLLDITARANLSTRAFYRNFDSKAALFGALFNDYAEDLHEALATAGSLEALAKRWIEVSRRHAGTVRAAIELVHRDTGEATEQRRLRDRCAGTVAAELLRAGVPWRRARAASLILVDMLDQYVLMETIGWVEVRDAHDIARATAGLVEQGLYGP